MTIPILITVGALITVVLGWIQWDQDRKNQTENDKLNANNRNLLNKISKISQSSNHQIFDMSNRLLDAQATINDFRNKTDNDLNGNGIPCFRWLLDTVETGIWHLNVNVVNYKSSPIHNMSVAYYDSYNSFKDQRTHTNSESTPEEKSEAYKYYDEYNKHINIGTLLREGGNYEIIDASFACDINESLDYAFKVSWGSNKFLIFSFDLNINKDNQTVHISKIEYSYNDKTYSSDNFLQNIGTEASK